MDSPSDSLTWVLVAGTPHHVSDFADLPPRRRPLATCPECARPLTLKLGRVRRYHAAHAPNDRCIATHPETALHINLKFHLAAELRAAIGMRQALLVRQTCASCDTTDDSEWIHGWDDVVVESRLGSERDARRPDVVLRRAGRPIAAIEVLVSHAVTDAKSSALAAAGVPWIEIRATARLVEGPDAWTIAHPIRVERSAAPWRCARHTLTLALRGARVVDLYHTGGARERLIYQLNEQLDDGRVRALSLHRGALEIGAISTTDDPSSKRDAWAKLRLIFADDVARLAAGEGSFSDSPMRWASGPSAENLVDEALADLVPGDSTPLATRYPRRWFYARERGEWFLPRDMRDVRWDRAGNDAFAAHPAWAAHRAVVRERPAPDDAWSTFVFAGRPTGAMFGHGAVVASAGATITIVDASSERGRRAIVVMTQATATDEVRRIDDRLEAEDVEHLWLSHPLDWTSDRAQLAWAPSGRDQRGRGVIVIDGVGVYRAEQFLSAFARGEPKLAPAAVRDRMADRVARLRQ